MATTKHGSGQACYESRAKVKCEECRAYARERSRREIKTPGTYAFDRAHGLGTAGQHARQYKRDRAEELDLRELNELLDNLERSLNGEAN